MYGTPIFVGNPIFERLHDCVVFISIPVFYLLGDRLSLISTIFGILLLMLYWAILGMVIAYVMVRLYKSRKKRSE